jgi:integrase
VGKVIERLAASAGVGKVSPHQFRHAHLTQGRNAGGDLDEAAASMRSTVSNLERYDDERLERALRFREPVAKLIG